MTYSLRFIAPAEREWRKLGETVRAQFKAKLAERLIAPRVPADALAGMPDHYKIKLRAAGYHLVYRVDDTHITVTVIVVGKRERGAVYSTARSRQP